LIEQAKREGVIAVLRKPLDIDSVMEFLEKFKEESAVLIIDDNKEFCESLRDCLLARGYKTDFATDALHAIDMVYHTNYDYVFLDMKLDGVNGLDVMTIIKRITPEVIVILMTAYQQEMKDYIREGLRRNAYACLYKPFDMERVLEMLNEVRHKKIEESLGYVTK